MLGRSYQAWCWYLRPSGDWYGPERRADDILEVITALKLEQPILVGNSCGGDILHTLGARNPDRIGGLMYLDAVTMKQTLSEYLARNELERAAVNQGYRARRAILTRWQRDLLAGVPDAKIVELPNANVYMFLLNEADVIRELRAFAASLPTQRGAAQ